ncbi:MAG: DUF6067 family protein [Tannerella sp.]|jgi:hypothetical protein|nr:DUF6067 family protein [Tannerella sp.]
MKKLLFLSIVLLSVGTLYSQENIEDLKTRSAAEESASVMRKVASEPAVERLLAENPAARYFCFTEDRAHDVRLDNAIPARWTERARESRTQFEGAPAPGEFYTWQIGVYAPYLALEDVKITFSDLRNEQGGKIPSSAIRCFNLGGVGKDGQPFVKRVDVPQGGVQAFWIGVDVGADCRRGAYRGKATVSPRGLPATTVTVTLNVTGDVLANHGDDEGFRKTRLRWLDASAGSANTLTSPYIPLKVNRQTIDWLGGTVELAASGLPRQITTRYDRSVLLNDTVRNPILNGEMTFVIETEQGVESFPAGKLQITSSTPTGVQWKSVQQNRHFEIVCLGRMEFDGFSEYKISVKAKNDLTVKDIRMETPCSADASRYLTGLGNRGGKMPALPVEWKWDVKIKHQDKLWIGDINAGLNMKWKDENYERPLVNIYYGFGPLKEPVSWGNGSKGGVSVLPDTGQGVRVKAYSGERSLKKGETLHYCLETSITPVKPLDLNHLAQERFYHGGGNTSGFISAAKDTGANYVTIHHAADIYPFINYPYSDETTPDLKRFVQEAHRKNLKLRVYYTTRELTVKIPEIWALRSLGAEVIYDGPGKDARTLILPNGPNEWLVKNLSTHFIPAWFNRIPDGKFKGDMDISVITTPDSRWNNYYLSGLDWMVKNIGIDGIYIDDSALDRETLRRCRRILDADGNRRLIDMHSWNHFNPHAGYSNSLHIYLDLLPYIDRVWIGEGFRDDNSLDFWLVEMSGIPFGLTGEILDARNIFRGMIFGMLPRLPWSGNPVPMWKLWDAFGMKDARMLGYWDARCPVKTSNENLPATVYINGDKALVAIANWTDLPQNGEWTIDETLLGFKPSKMSLPEIRKTQWGNPFRGGKLEVMGRSGLIVLLEK